MPYVNIKIHAVWGTKNRHHFLTKEIKALIISHIKENAKKKEIHIDSINGYAEHMHALISLNADMSISKVMQLIKGESAFWINKEKLTPQKFEWADEYFAASVSKSALPKVRAYIQNQEAHHKKITFEQEYQDFVSKLNFNNQG